MYKILNLSYLIFARDFEKLCLNSCIKLAFEQEANILSLPVSIEIERFVNE